MEITVCIGSSCHLKGSMQVVERLQKLIATHHLVETIDLRGSFCMNRCQTGVSVRLDGMDYSLTPESAERFFLETVLPRCTLTRRALD
jgi:NADH:ubiquinone oxidoreductase subunit E